MNELDSVPIKPYLQKQAESLQISSLEVLKGLTHN